MGGGAAAGPIGLPIEAARANLPIPGPSTATNAANYVQDFWASGFAPFIMSIAWSRNQRLKGHGVCVVSRPDSRGLLEPRVGRRQRQVALND
jgi:hypothetical protein